MPKSGVEYLAQHPGRKTRKAGNSNTKEKITWAENEVSRILDHISPALLHKIVDERSKTNLVVFVEGGLAVVYCRRSR